MDKKKLTNMLGAGTITGFILAIFLLFSGANAQGEQAAATVAPATGITQVVPMENYNLLQAQNDQLAQDLQTMQAREQQYAQQITAANNLAAQQPVKRNYEGEHDFDDD